jgi:polysaccharide export outer membrane protein
MRSFLLPLTFWLSLFASAALSAQDQAKADADYILRADDVVSLSVYEQPDLAMEVSILANGQASFRIIGSVKIAGLSISAATEKVIGLYAKDYYHNPKGSLTVIQHVTDFVSVIGQVKQPGTVAIPHRGRLDVGSAIASVGGISETADPKNIQLVSADGKTRVLSNLGIQGKEGRIALQAGDRIIVNESPFARSTFIVLGEVEKGGSFPLPKSGILNLATALATAGGLSEFAAPSGVKLTKANGASSVYTVQAINSGSAGRVSIGPGDSITVAKNPFANKTVTMLGQVNRKGAIPFPLSGRLDIMTAIAGAGGFTDIANAKKVKVTRSGKDYLVNTRDLAARKGGTVWLYPGDIVTVAERII